LQLGSHQRAAPNRNGYGHDPLQDWSGQNRTSPRNRYRFLRSSNPSTARPAMRPQKADPTPKKTRPDAVTAKVTVAAILSRSSLSAMDNALASGASSARPATSTIRLDGSTAKTATSEAPKAAKIR